MKNRILSIVRRVIPYSPDMRALPLVKGVLDVILLQQLDYWFERSPDGFYKFLEPNNCEHYRKGDSWTEELAISKKEFKNSFSHIGTAYTSKSKFDKSHDKFQGKYYCSYYDRIKRLTFYFRNHDFLDCELNKIVQVQTQSDLSGNDQRDDLEVTNGNFPKGRSVTSIPIYTKNRSLDEQTRELDRAREKSDFSEISFSEEQTSSEIVLEGEIISVGEPLNPALTKNQNEFKEESSGCNTNEIKVSSHQNKKPYQLTRKDFAWLTPTYRQYKPENWSNDAVVLSKILLSDLKDAYEAVNCKMDTLRQIFIKALICVQKTPALWNYDLPWVLRNQKFLELGQRCNGQDVRVPTARLQRAIDESNETRDRIAGIISRMES